VGILVYCIVKIAVKALYEALDEKRRALGMSWAAVTREVNRTRTTLRPIASSTITGLKDKFGGEGDGVLQMLLWLERTPESFIPGIPDAKAPRYQLPQPGPGQILRWDTKKLHAALNAKRLARGMTWNDLADEIFRHTPAMLTNLAKGGRVGFPHVMPIVLWLDQPAATFTHLAAW
jgi:hypothetical protein